VDNDVETEVELVNGELLQEICEERLEEDREEIQE